MMMIRNKKKEKQQRLWHLISKWKPSKMEVGQLFKGKLASGNLFFLHFHNDKIKHQ